MSGDYSFIDLTDEKVAEIAKRFGVTADEVRAEWAQVQDLGPEGAIQEFEKQVVKAEADVDAAVKGTYDYLREDRLRAISDLYQDTIDASDLDKISVPDLILTMSILLYKLAEAQIDAAAQISDGNYRQGG